MITLPDLSHVDPKVTDALIALFVSFTAYLMKVANDYRVFRKKAADDKYALIVVTEKLKSDKVAAELRARELIDSLNAKSRESDLANEELLREQIAYKDRMNIALTEQYKAVDNMRIETVRRLDAARLESKESEKRFFDEQLRMTAENGKYYGQIEILTAQQARLMENGTRRDDELATLRVEVSQLRDQLNAKQDELDRTQEDLKSSRQAESQLRQQVKTLEKEVERLTTRVAVLEKDQRTEYAEHELTQLKSGAIRNLTDIDNKLDSVRGMLADIKTDKQKPEDVSHN